MLELPIIEGYFIENKLSPTGLGEPILPLADGVLAKALKAKKCKRIYNQSFSNYPELLTVDKKIIS